MKILEELIHSKEDFSFSNEYPKNNISDSMVSALNVSNSAIYKINVLEFVSHKDFVEESVKVIRKAKETINIGFYILSDSIWLKVITNELVKKLKKVL